MIKKNEPVQVSNDEFEYQIDDEFVIVDLENDDDTNNTMGEVFQAFKKSISKLKNKDKTPFFKTIMIDTGQYERLLSKINTEGEVAFPACFIRFTNVHFLVSQQRIGEGRCMVRVRFVLNRMDHQTVKWETFPFYIAEKVNQVIQDAKDKEPSLQERCNLQFFDMPERTKTLQPYWLDYEVYFRITSADKYRNWLQRYVIIPPFTNNSDTNNGKPDLTRPNYNEASTIDELNTGDTE